MGTSQATHVNTNNLDKKSPNKKQNKIRKEIHNIVVREIHPHRIKRINHNLTSEEAIVVEIDFKNWQPLGLFVTKAHWLYLFLKWINNYSTN